MVVVRHTAFLHKTKQIPFVYIQAKVDFFFFFQAAFGQTARGICKVLQAVFICSILDTS